MRKYSIFNHYASSFTYEIIDICSRIDIVLTKYVMPMPQLEHIEIDTKFANSINAKTLKTNKNVIWKMHGTPYLP